MSDVQIALLRAVNLAGQRRVAMDDLRAAATEAGLSEARTVLQSGNLVYRTSLSVADARRALSAALTDRTGLMTEIIVRTADEWSRIIERNPLESEAQDTPGRVQVFVCSAEPGEIRRVTYERLVVEGRDVYVFYPNGIARSRIQMDVPATGRNWNTVLKIAAAASL